MSVLKVALPKQNDVHLSARAASLILDRGDGRAALLYIYILSHGGELDVTYAAERLKLSSDAVLDALAVLTELGLCGETETPSIPERPDKMPEYTQTDVAEHVGSDPAFKYLAEYTEERLGKLLSTVDMQTLLGIYSWLGLPVDVICLLITSCIDETRRRYGPGRVPTMRTIEKRAKLWVRDGVMTCGRAEEYLRETEKKNAALAKIARILNIGGRATAPTEERYIASWIAMGLSDELIAAAYDRTVVNTGALKWKYMDTILKSWHDAGCKTAADIPERKSATPRFPERQKDKNEELDSALRLRELNRKKRMESGE